MWADGLSFQSLEERLPDLQGQVRGELLRCRGRQLASHDREGWGLWGLRAQGGVTWRRRHSSRASVAALLPFSGCCVAGRASLLISQHAYSSLAVSWRQQLTPACLPPSASLVFGHV